MQLCDIFPKTSHIPTRTYPPNFASKFAEYCELNFKKTGILFNLSVMMSAITIDSNIDLRQLNRLSEWGYLFGLAFQISDDILDLEKDLRDNNPNLGNILTRGEMYGMLAQLIQYLSDEIINLNQLLAPQININTDLIISLLQAIQSRAKN